MFVSMNLKIDKFLVVISLAIAVAFGFSNCKKDDGTSITDPKKETVEDKVMKNTWIEIAREVNGQDAFKSLADCEKDNEHRFMADSVYRLSEGADVCDPSDPGPVFLEWWLKDNSTIINIARTDYVIDFITDSTFQYSSGGVGGSFKHTYKKK